MSRISKLRPPEKKEPRRGPGGRPVAGPRSQSTDRRTTRWIYGQTEWVKSPISGGTVVGIGLTQGELDELNAVCEMYDCVRHQFVKEAVMAAVRWARQKRRRTA